MSELVEWLTKVLDDEYAASQSPHGNWEDRDRGSLVAKIVSARGAGGSLTQWYLADISAKRRIVERYRDAMANASKRDELDHSAKLTLALLLWPVWDIATAYADREGYDESWRP